MECLEVKMSNSFVFLLESRKKLENIWEKEIKRDKMEMILWQNEKDG